MSDLPPVPRPRGNYLPATTWNGLVHVSGQVSRNRNEVTVKGCLRPGDDLSLARHAAELAALRCLAVLEQEAGGLDRVERILMVRGYIRSDPDFEDHPQVMNAASDLIVARLGERGQHSRIALGAGSIPTGGLVEIEMTAVLRAPDRTSNEQPATGELAP